jgi:hypothetical protein
MQDHPFNRMVQEECSEHASDEHATCPHGVVMCAYWMDVTLESIRQGEHCGIACVSPVTSPSPLAGE